MSLRHVHPSIPKDGSDAFVNCKLNRKKYAEVLTSIVQHYSDGFVLAINNKWGEGKTVFVKMWEQDLNNQGFSTLYFNAWENDFQDEVIVALLSELEELKNKAKAEKQFNEVLDKTAKFLKRVAPVVARGVAAKALGDKASEDIVAAITKFTTEELSEEIDGFNKKKRGVIEFRESLEKFVKKVDNDNPVVFIIDELDRCRPDYSVRILEQIEHLFAVKGIVFVLSIDKEQLGHSIRGVYGSDRIDADEYLRRFIDLEYTIPVPEIENSINYYFEFFKLKEYYEVHNREQTPEFKQEKDNFLNVIKTLFRIKSISLRLQERIMGHLRVVINAFGVEQFTFPDITIMAIYLKIFHPEIYLNVKYKRFETQELVNKLEEVLKYPMIKEDDKRILAFGIAKFVYAYANYYRPHVGARNFLIYDQNLRQDVLQLSSTFDHDKFQNIYRYMSNEHRISSIGLEWIIDKVELTETMKF